MKIKIFDLFHFLVENDWLKFNENRLWIIGMILYENQVIVGNNTCGYLNIGAYYNFE